MDLVKFHDYVYSQSDDVFQVVNIDGTSMGLLDTNDNSNSRLYTMGDGVVIITGIDGSHIDTVALP